MSVFEVIPVEVGTRHSDVSLLCYLTDPGKPLTIYYRLWVVRNAERTVLVDTGLPADEALERGVHDARDVEEALRSVGVEAADVDTVVLTHFHWDHASNASRFPRATFVVQRAEMEALHDPLRGHPSVGRFYSADVSIFHELSARGRFHIVDGDEQIVAGIDAILLGGHTRGSQAVAVTTRGGPAVITGDAIPLNRNFEESIPTGIHLDLPTAIRALERVREVEPVIVYTAHDRTSQLSVPARATPPAG